MLGGLFGMFGWFFSSSSEKTDLVVPCPDKADPKQSFTETESFTCAPSMSCSYSENLVAEESAYSCLDVSSLIVLEKSKTENTRKRSVLEIKLEEINEDEVCEHTRKDKSLNDILNDSRPLAHRRVRELMEHSMTSQSGSSGASFGTSIFGNLYESNDSYLRMIQFSSPLSSSIASDIYHSASEVELSPADPYKIMFDSAYLRELRAFLNIFHGMWWQDHLVHLPPQKALCQLEGSCCGYVMKKVGYSKFEKRLVIITVDGMLVVYKFHLIGLCAGLPLIGKVYNLNELSKKRVQDKKREVIITLQTYDSRKITIALRDSKQRTLLPHLLEHTGGNLHLSHKN